MSEHDEMTEEAGNLLEVKKAWENLFQNRAWIQLVEALQSQTDTLQQELLYGDVTCEGDVYKMERRKGMLEGRLSLTATATAMYEGACVDLNMERKGVEE